MLLGTHSDNAKAHCAASTAAPMSGMPTISTKMERFGNIAVHTSLVPANQDKHGHGAEAFAN